MEIYDFSECEYSNRNGSYGGAARDKVEKNIALVDKNLSTKIDFIKAIPNECKGYEIITEPRRVC